MGDQASDHPNGIGGGKNDGSASCVSGSSVNSDMGGGGGVVVVGSLNIDLTAFTAHRPQPGQTVLGTAMTTTLGGKGANQAIAAARAGARTWMVGCVGDDPYAELALTTLSGEGVDTTGIRVVPGPTGVAHIRVDAVGENDIVVIPQANAALTTAEVDRALRSLTGQVQVLLLQLEIPIPVAVHAAQVGHDLGLTVILDPTPVPDHPLPDTLWGNVDVLKPNQTEAEQLMGGRLAGQLPNEQQLASWFAERGVRRVILTRGVNGAVVIDTQAGNTHAGDILASDTQQTVTRHQPYPVDSVNVVDSTAAGDAFVGHLAAALAAGMQWSQAMDRAMAAGALAVTVAGASPSLPTADAVDSLQRNRFGHNRSGRNRSETNEAERNWSGQQ